MRFARSAFEGMLRYQRGIKTPGAEILAMRYVKLAIPEGTEWCGVRLGLAWRNGGLVVELLPQVAFWDAERTLWVHITSEELGTETLKTMPGLDTSRTRVYAKSVRERDALLARLAEMGIAFSKLADIDPPVTLFDGGDISVEITFTINKGIRRCIAKYAFNHLAFVSGSAFVLEPDFDPIRQFIRYGETLPYPLVTERYEPILRDDLKTQRQTDGHLLTLNWSVSGLDLVGQVSLFNSITYSVALARRYSGTLWIPVQSGLHFNIRKKCIERMVCVREALLLPRYQQRG